MVDVALSAGWTIDNTLDALTMSWLKALREHWRINPPVHKLVAAYVGYKPPREPIVLSADDPSARLGRSILAGIEAAQRGKPTPPSSGSGEDLVAMFPGGAIKL